MDAKFSGIKKLCRAGDCTASFPYHFLYIKSRTGIEWSGRRPRCQKHMTPEKELEAMYVFNGG
jgi:hypothetical protein